ncbi:MAG TPA: serine/threonine-protein kinase [Thermoanaerobaculia bacterium]|nr:serine/threonine-protein kinase [Thermoanaerobaculia bacterium]
MTPGLPTDLDRWRRISAILDLVLDVSPEERSACLDEACAGDAELRAEAEAFLAADAEAGAFLGVPAGELAPELLAEAEEEESEAADLAGHQVGRYRLLREIGGGGMGTVYEAEDTQLGRRVAVKLLPPEYSRDRRAKERFLREARTAAAVDHPNLCTVHDAGESEGRLYIVLSFYEGETLRDRIRRGPMPLAEAREVAIQVARGLARAHEAGIVHRDIKPANVILPRRGEAKILDFGIARLEGDEVSLTRTGASWGTPAYMSPEQARGEPVDGRTDVWSLGVMIYEMVAGRRPFGGESIEALVSSILTQEPEPLERLRPDVPPELAQVVDKALAKAPEERYANAAELLADLELERAPGRRPSRRRKALRVGQLAAALAAFVLLVFALWRFWPGPPLRVAVLQPVVKL